MLLLYFPESQAAHGPPFGPVYPALQRQSVFTVCPAARVLLLLPQAEQVAPDAAPVTPEYVCKPQSVHAALPVSALNFPGAHAVHAPAGPVVPGLQSGK